MQFKTATVKLFSNKSCFVQENIFGLYFPLSLHSMFSKVYTGKKNTIRNRNGKKKKNHLISFMRNTSNTIYHILFPCWTKFAENHKNCQVLIE